MITPPAKSRNIKSDRDNFIDQTRNRTSAISAFCMMKITARHARMSAKINLKFMELSFRVDQDPNGEFFLFFSCFFASGFFPGLSSLYRPFYSSLLLNSYTDSIKIFNLKSVFFRSAFCFSLFMTNYIHRLS